LRWGEFGYVEAETVLIGPRLVELLQGEDPGINATEI